ncbi:EF-P 5-aminopentanol modification-associated protein YfmF [Lacticaseibacillus zhaodongensis]|uniref:EF-P 5-aminopentanol modification-associated protein YfmF n=1 Tax=Lacticaseibacillus zhaodongensis TaxID=2668065 RepID=UPI0012D30AD4|nr:pitrilysin family protein [Lacticaseibacillus zhaodongensis]
MRVKIVEGVHLNVVPSKQFKTTHVNIQFLAPLRRETIGARTLLTSLLETSSADYPSQNLLSAQLEKMYGASFGIGVSRSGRVHRVGASINVLDDNFTESPLLPEAFAFLRRVLFRPLIKDGSFDAATFARERDNLAIYLNSMNDDRGTQAGLRVQQTYFDDPAQAVPSFGTAADLGNLTAQSLVDTYTDMLQNDQIEIIVMGNVDADHVADLTRELNFAPRADLNVSIPYDQAVHGGIRLFQESEDVKQSKLNLAYHVQTDSFGPRYYAAELAAQLFGGSPLSLLFRNVREKQSMAYYANASTNLNRHIMMVQTGIDAVNRARVEELIGEQLAMVANGKFTDGQLEAVRTGMLSDRRAALDSMQYLSDMALTAALFPNRVVTPERELELITAATRAEVQQAAAGMQLQAVYFLKGETK